MQVWEETQADTGEHVASQKGEAAGLAVSSLPLGCSGLEANVLPSLVVADFEGKAYEARGGMEREHREVRGHW